MSRYERYILLISFLWAMQMPMSAQVQVWMDRDSILIGEEVHLYVQMPDTLLKEEVTLPAVRDTISKIEFLSTPTVDTVADMWRMQARITSFDSGRWEIKDWSLGGVAVPKLVLHVGSPPVDLEKPIKDIYPFGKSESDISFGKLALILFIIYYLAVLAFMYWWTQRKPRKKDPLQNLAPYERAQAELDILEQEKAWENEENLKEYYAELTDVLRNYFDQEYHTHAMESTSTQLLKSIKKVKRLNKRRKDIAWLLERADLAKFAKTRPSEAENIEALKKTRSILYRTRPLNQNEKKN